MIFLEIALQSSLMYGFSQVLEKKFILILSISSAVGIACGERLAATDRESLSDPQPKETRIRPVGKKMRDVVKNWK